MSRSDYVKHLEHDLSASQKIINDLVQELHEVREQLKYANANESTKKQQTK